MDEKQSDLVAKVPHVTFLFWIVKIFATTLRETGGDAVTMSWLGETTPGAKGTGYLVGTGSSVSFLSSRSWCRSGPKNFIRSFTG